MLGNFKFYCCRLQIFYSKSTYLKKKKIQEYQFDCQFFVCYKLDWKLCWIQTNCNGNRQTSEFTASGQIAKNRVINAIILCRANILRQNENNILRAILQTFKYYKFEKLFLQGDKQLKVLCKFINVIAKQVG